jgi:hypothetical protein
MRLISLSFLEAGFLAVGLRVGVGVSGCGCGCLLMQHFLYLSVLPQGQGELLPILGIVWVCMSLYCVGLFKWILSDANCKDQEKKSTYE